MSLAAAVLRLDADGSPRMLRLFAALVEAESRHFAAAASQPAGNDLVRAFRGGATPTVPIADFLKRIQRCNYLFEGGVYILAGAYLARFMRSRAAHDAGILVEPATAHRLVSVAVLLGAKFSSPRHFERRVEAFQVWSLILNSLKSWDLIFKDQMRERVGSFCQRVSEILKTPPALESG